MSNVGGRGTKLTEVGVRWRKGLAIKGGLEGVRRAEHASCRRQSPQWPVQRQTQ